MTRTSSARPSKCTIPPWWLVILPWTVLCLATLNYNGPFYDEAIYVTAGLRTLEGHGISDGYLGWFAGSLLWPTLAGIGYQLGGLIGTRVIAVILAAAGFIALVAATENLYGQRVAIWSALVMALSGPFFALARLGVYDVAAFAGLGVSFWAITQLARHDHRGWLALAVAGFSLAVLAKYPVLLMIFPLVGTLAALRRHKAGLDTMLFLFASGAAMLALALPARATLSSLLLWQLENKPTFGVTRAMVAFRFAYLAGAPLLLALVGALLMPGRRWLALSSLSAWFLWPAYHLISDNPVSASKHLVFGLMFVVPLAGFALARISGRRLGGAIAAVALVISLTVLGAVQGIQSTREWPDVRLAASYLSAQVRPGQTLLINEAWPFAMYLYGGGHIKSPWDIYDAYRIAAGQSPVDLCRHDWYIDTQGSYRWPAAIEDEIARCDSFEPIFSSQSMVINLGQGLDFVTYSVKTTIWENTEVALAKWETGRSD